MLSHAISGARSSLGVLALLVLVGLLTATWRASGTMAYLVQQVVFICPVPLVLLATFLLCCAVSFLVGSAFGTAATVGAICVVVASSAQVPLVLAGGAVLSGSYFGDRCSPVSGSALLVASLTETKVAENMRTMCKTSIVPFAATCALFAALGWVFGENMAPVAPPAYLDACYSLDAVTILPAHLENTIVLMAVLVPWSTAVVVPLAAIGAPLTCILAAFYLYLVPLWNACTALVSRHAQNMAAKGRAARCS